MVLTSFTLQEMQWLMLQQDHPEDFVIATGVQYSVRDFVVAAAKELGIASNIRFCKPNDIISRVHQLCTYPSRPALDSETSRWYLYALLGSENFSEAHPDIHGYFGSNDIKRIALADELADLFDQYQVYRYEHIKTWNQLTPNSLQATGRHGFGGR